MGNFICDIQCTVFFGIKRGLFGNSDQYSYAHGNNVNKYNGVWN